MTVSTGCQLTSYPSELPSAVTAYGTTNVKHVFKCSNIKVLFLIPSVRTQYGGVTNGKHRLNRTIDGAHRLKIIRIIWP